MSQKFCLQRYRPTSRLITGAGIGAALIYLFDPTRGARRRALLRDKIVRTAALTEQVLERTWRDARTRVPDEAPTAPIAIGSLGVGLAWYGASRRSVPGKAVMLVGAALLLKGLSNLKFTQPSGDAARRRAVELRKTTTIAAPVGRVFAFWCNYENFPHLLSRIRDVRKVGNNRSRWTLTGPAGANVSWDVFVTDFVENDVVAWETERDSLIQHGGVVRFMDNRDGTTTIHVMMAYNPLAGALAYSLASVLGMDPQTMLDEELARMKTVLESGITPHSVPQPVGDTVPAKE